MARRLPAVAAAVAFVYGASAEMTPTVSRMPSMPRMPLPHQIGIARAPSNVPQPVSQASWRGVRRVRADVPFGQSLVGRKELPVAGESEASLWKVDSSLWQVSAGCELGGTESVF
jgi:hypothetical protein